MRIVAIMSFRAAVTRNLLVRLMNPGHKREKRLGSGPRDFRFAEMASLPRLASSE